MHREELLVHPVAHMPPDQVLAGLSADDAARRVPGITHSIEDALIHVAQHNAHHLGQVVTLRQVLGCWPPPGGSYTW